MTATPPPTARVLILIETSTGNTYRLAEALREGIAEYVGAHASDPAAGRIEVVMRRVASQGATPVKPDEAARLPLARTDELTGFDGIAIGGPVHFGNIGVNTHLFLNRTLDFWKTQQLAGIPATVFVAACSGGGREAAILSAWHVLASHGMLIVPVGNLGTEGLERDVAHGNTPFGASTLGCLPPIDSRPSRGELDVARAQGRQFARAVLGMRGQRAAESATGEGQTAAAAAALPATATSSVERKLAERGLKLPPAPAPVGSYRSFAVAGRLVYINQIALRDGSVPWPGVIGEKVSLEQAREATLQTLLNTLAVLREAAGGNLDRVRRAVQLTGFFQAPPSFTGHAGLMNAASDLLVDLFGEPGRHARATVGATSLPMGSPVEIQAIFELC